MPAGALQGQELGRRGRSTPVLARRPGDDPHHYEFTLYALRSPLPRRTGRAPDGVCAAVEGAALAAGGSSAASVAEA